MEIKDIRNIQLGKNYVSDFLDFVKKNIVFEIFLGVTVLFIYGTKIFNYNVSLDTEIYLGYNDTNWAGIGRYGLIVLQKIFCLNEFSMFRENILAALLHLVSTIITCHFVSFFSGNKCRKVSLWIFGASFVSSGIWVEQYYFTLQSAEVAFAYFLVPIAAVLLLDGYTGKSIFKIVLSVFLVTFGTSAYQSLSVVFAAYILIAVFMCQKNDFLDKKDLWKICFFTLGIFIFAIIFNLITPRFFRILTHDPKSPYLSRMIEADRSYILNFMKYIYMQIFANNKIASSIFDPFMEKVANSGTDAIQTLHNGSYSVANIFYIPTLILYFVFIFRNKSKNLLSILVSFLIPITMIIFPLLLSGTSENRAQLMMPLVWSFLFLFVLDNIQNKKLLIILSVLIGYSLYNQAQRGEMLFYSDQIRFKKDEALASDINKELVKINKDNVPVLLYGRTHYTYNRDFAYGEDIGKSMFNCNSFHEDYNSTRRGIAFMRALNYPWRSAVYESSIEEIRAVRKIAETMPSYPNEGYVRNFGNIVVVKISEDVE